MSEIHNHFITIIILTLACFPAFAIHSIIKITKALLINNCRLHCSLTISKPVTCAILQYSAIQFSEAGSTRAKLTPQWIIISQNWEVNIKIYTATEKSSNALWGG